MATRTKTIEFVTTVDTTQLAIATNRDKTIAIYIPEGGGTITWKSCVVEVFLRGDNTAAANLSSVVTGISTDGITFSEATDTNPVGNSGESECFHFQRDVTSYFTTNWSGTSATWYVRWRGSGIATINHSFKVILTYEYDDTQTTHIKTVRVPFESLSVVIPTGSWQQIGSNQIPDFGGSFLPEASVVVRQVWVEFHGNEMQNNNTSHICSMRINGAGSTDWWDKDGTLASDCWAYASVDITAEDLSVARSLEVTSSAAASAFKHLGGLVCVTYEYAPASSTTILNSVMLSAFDEGGKAGALMSGVTIDRVGEATLLIPEPGTITLKQSGVLAFFRTNAARTMTLKFGGQTGIAWATSNADLAGQNSVVQRIDAGSGDASGANFMTLARGFNTLVSKARGQFVNGLCGFFYVNYTSGKATDGVGAHTQTRHFLNTPRQVGYGGATWTAGITNAHKIDIVENVYYISDLITRIVNVGNVVAQEVLVTLNAGERQGTGFATVGIDSQGHSYDPENGVIYGLHPARDLWWRHPREVVASRINPEANRTAHHASMLANGGRWWADSWATYSTITYSVSGTVSGSGGGTVNLDLIRTDTGETVDSTSRVSNGAYSFTWYDNVTPVAVRAFEDSTHVGASNEAVAV